MSEPKLSVRELSGNIQFSYGKGKLSFDAKDLVIDGFTLPTFSWGWLAVTLAQGVVSAFGGMVFTAIISGLTKKSDGPSIEEIFQRILPEFDRIVRAEIEENSLREYYAESTGVLQRYREYVNDPNPNSLSLLLRDSSEALALLSSLDFKAYSGYMNMAGLRLNILQERAKASLSKGGAGANFEAQRTEAIQHHQSAITLIENDTDPLKVVSGAAEKNLPVPFRIGPGALGWNPSDGDVYWHRDQQLIGGPVTGLTWVRNGAWVPPNVALNDNVFRLVFSAALPGGSAPYVDWEARRKDIKSKSTDIGQLAVNRWNGAPAAAESSLHVEPSREEASGI